MTAFDLQVDPSRPGMSFHTIDRAKDKNFWSVRVSRDIRLIVHKTNSSLLLCYVDHHDKAYAWAERRRLEVHPTTGAAQMVEIRERVEEIVRPVFVDAEVAHPSPVDLPPLFVGTSDSDLLDFGVPPEWVEEVRLATEATLLDLTDHLPAEAAEALLELATGGKPRVPQALPAEDPFEHPDAQRRFRVVTDLEELKAALDFPWEKWTVFLHPDQRSMVERDYSGPARVSGSAGTGKTVVALHRAAHLARSKPDSRVLLTTFSDPLANALGTKLKRLIAGEPLLGERIDVYSIGAIGHRLYAAHAGTPKIASREVVRELVVEAAAQAEHRFTIQFLMTEWEEVVDGWQLDGWEAYRDVARLGRKTRVAGPKREELWTIFEGVRGALRERGLLTLPQMFAVVAKQVKKNRNPVFDFCVVDESQDLSVAHLRFLAALGGGRPNSLFFAGDLGQRIFQYPFSWKALGVDIRGRSRTLRVNYRTSHQIREKTDRLLGPSVADVDENIERRDDTVSVFNGPDPVLRALPSEKEEVEHVGEWLAGQVAEGLLPHEIAVFVRSEEQLGRARDSVAKGGLKFVVLDEKLATRRDHVAISTMDLAKGLEFRSVVVMACDDEVLPLQARIETVGDDSDLKEVYDTERHLLYVACTRARDNLLVTGVEPTSEFLDDMRRSRSASAS